MPNYFAYIILIIWPFFSIWLYKRQKPLLATLITIFGGFLILPVGVEFDFPLIPSLNKETIPAISALIGCNYISKYKIALFPSQGIERWIVLILVFSPIITVFNNQEHIFYGEGFLPGLTIKDALSSIVFNYIMLIPFLLGIQLIKTYEDQLELFKVLVFLALVYSLPVIFEIRMSPQLHDWVYGFFPHQFSQQVRYGGFRAVVFLGHGLKVSMFIAISLGAALILWKNKIKVFNFKPILIVGYLVVLLLLNKGAGAILLGILLTVVIKWFPVSTIKKLSILICVLILLYPMFSIFDFFPHQELIYDIAEFDAARAQSLEWRFDNESILLQHAKDKLFFGWGGWGRNRPHSSLTTDGLWIMVLGTYGLVGFGARFGIVLLVVWKAIKNSYITNEGEHQVLIYHAFLVATIFIDQIPNASLNSWLWLIIGALLGRANYIFEEKK